MTRRLNVLLTTEGTYPFHQGGVSTWCHLFLEKLPDINYTVYSIIMNPYVTQKYTLPAGTSLIRVPLWGTEEPSEHLELPFAQVYAAKHRTSSEVIKNKFVPLFTTVVSEIISSAHDPYRLGEAFLGMYRYFQHYDYRNSFLSEAVYKSFTSQVLAACHDPANRWDKPSVYDMIQSLGWLYRFLVTLSTPVPQVDLTHATAAAFCGIPCVLAKLLYGTPFLLTEHGVYLREQYLSLARREQSTYLNTFLIRLIRAISALNYAYADQISPVCQYNTRWESHLGVPKERIRVIYNGVDPEVYTPAKIAISHSRPTVVSVARIDPVKDQMTLLRAAALVKEQIPNVCFLVYGAVTIPEYQEECLKLREHLNLTECFTFAGHTADPASAYHTGDVVALSSVTEGFPYAVVEAMMTGKAVVATDVGGVKEAVADCGLVVPPRDHNAMAEALVQLLTDNSLRNTLGSEARERALSFFTVDRSVNAYMASYRRLATPSVPSTALHHQKSPRQQLFAERGYALVRIGLWQDAISQFRQAIAENTASPAVPVLLDEIARVLDVLGQGDQAEHERSKAKIIGSIRQHTA